jgi:hypothetical protein
MYKITVTKFGVQETFKVYAVSSTHALLVAKRCWPNCHVELGGK